MDRQTWISVRLIALSLVGVILVAFGLIAVCIASYEVFSSDLSIRIMTKMLHPHTER